MSEIWKKSCFQDWSLWNNQVLAKDFRVKISPQKFLNFTWMLTWGDAMTDPPTTHQGFPSPIGFPGTLTQHEVGQDDRNLWLRKELGVFWSNFFFPEDFQHGTKKIWHQDISILLSESFVLGICCTCCCYHWSTSGGSAPSCHCGGSWLSKLFLPHLPRIRSSLKSGTKIC